MVVFALMYDFSSFDLLKYLIIIYFQKVLKHYSNKS